MQDIAFGFKLVLGSIALVIIDLSPFYWNFGILEVAEEEVTALQLAFGPLYISIIT